MREDSFAIVSRTEMARRIMLKPGRCPVESCTGRLKVRSLDDRAGEEDDHHSADVPRFSIGCNNPTMHVWKKEDLYYLRQVQPTVVIRMEAWQHHPPEPDAGPEPVVVDPALQVWASPPHPS